ncbi:MAG: hypothetical protein O3C43_05975 [Verrucomicrobia bacterium]|nr:hypothetical protein [Verrucomicrobiota bacterium]
MKSIASFTFVCFFLAINQAEACPVCFQSNGEESRWAFYATTALLTFLPLSMVGGAVVYLRKRFDRLKNELVN